MSFRERAFGGVDDERALRAFGERETPDALYSGQFHPGDVSWALYQNVVFDPARSVRLWEDGDGRLVAHAWCDPPTMLRLGLARERSGDRRLLSAILDWFEGLAGPGQLSVEDPGGAPALVELLGQRGYRPGDSTMRQLARPLARALEQPV